jgi:hypothetical protein
MQLAVGNVAATPRRSWVRATPRRLPRPTPNSAGRFEPRGAAATPSATRASPPRAGPQLHPSGSFRVLGVFRGKISASLTERCRWNGSAGRWPAGWGGPPQPGAHHLSRTGWGGGNQWNEVVGGPPTTARGPRALPVQLHRPSWGARRGGGSRHRSVALLGGATGRHPISAGIPRGGTRCLR